MSAERKHTPGCYAALNGDVELVCSVGCPEARRQLVATVASMMVHEPLSRFAVDMEERLAANDPKGGWHQMTFGDLLERLLEEVRELDQECALEKKDVTCIVKEAADVANFAMMIADQARSGRGEACGVR